jgi:hypothetical protein
VRRCTNRVENERISGESTTKEEKRDRPREKRISEQESIVLFLLILRAQRKENISVFQEREIRGGGGGSGKNVDKIFQCPSFIHVYGLSQCGALHAIEFGKELVVVGPSLNRRPLSLTYFSLS